MIEKSKNFEDKIVSKLLILRFACLGAIVFIALAGTIAGLFGIKFDPLFASFGFSSDLAFGVFGGIVGGVLKAMHFA